MGYAFGSNNNGRDIGYGVQATCDIDGCENQIDRGLAFCCGGLEGTGNAGMDDEQYCGDYACYDHLYYVPDQHAPRETIQVCAACNGKKDWWELAND